MLVSTLLNIHVMSSVQCVALRAEAALRARLPKDAKRNASISPYDKGLGDAYCLDPFQNELEEEKFPCIGELLQHTKKGANSCVHYMAAHSILI